MTDIDERMFEALRVPVGVYLMLGCIVVFTMQYLMKKFCGAEALFLVQYYRQRLGLSFLVVFLWWVPLLMFLFRYATSFWKSTPKDVFVGCGVDWCTWLAKDKT